MRDVIVFDTGNEPYYRNQLFDPTVASRYPGALSACRFHELAIGAGYRVMTADLVAESGIDEERIIMISEQTTPWSDKLVRKGAALGVLTCMETPSFAWRFYRDLPKISQHYRHAFLFSGAAPRVQSSSTKFHPTLFPQPHREISEFAVKSWKDRAFAAMVHGNQVRLVIKPAHLLASLGDPDLKRELYSERRKAIRYFHRHRDFHLYGGGWQKWKFGVAYSDYRAALSCYQGRCENKIATLAGYRFSICFENTVFPGYITEKLFDCFYAGCVPVYYGAPDICDYVPKNCFIDFRDFPNYSSLDEFLAQLGHREFNAYREAAMNFLKSKAFEPFSHEHYAQTLLEAVQDYGA